MLIGVMGEKGGTGKSIIATNLAALLASAGRDVLLVDTDTQRTSSNWQATRSENAELPVVHCVSKFGSQLSKEVRHLAERYQDIVIDAGGRDSVEMRAAMSVVQVAVLPFQPAQFDLWTVQKMHELLVLASGLNPDVKALAVLNQVEPTHTYMDYLNAKAFITEYEGLNMATEPVRKRAAFKRAASEGMGVHEWDRNPDSKATYEIRRLLRDIESGISQPTQV